MYKRKKHQVQARQQRQDERTNEREKKGFFPLVRRVQMFVPLEVIS